MVPLLVRVLLPVKLVVALLSVEAEAQQVASRMEGLYMTRREMVELAVPMQTAMHIQVLLGRMGMDVHPGSVFASPHSMCMATTMV